ncbi:MAG: hypothetical protein JXQ27_03170 [Acidobacteria bacterium]|nr:hypothetical protein [Acidobacteriota bacterium]
MTCKRMRRDLALLAGDELPRRHIPAVERHLAACAGCRQFLAELRATRQDMSNLGNTPLPPEDLAHLHRSVLQDLATDGDPAAGRRASSRPGVWFSGRRLAGVVTAALLLAAVPGVWWLNRPSEGPAPGLIMVHRHEPLPAVPLRFVPDLPALRPEVVASVETARVMQPPDRPSPHPEAPVAEKPGPPPPVASLAEAAPAPTAVPAGRPVPPSREAGAPPIQTLVRMATEDPNVVIFWILEKKGEDIS